MKKIIKRTSSMVPLRIKNYRQRKSKRLTSGGEVELTSFENPMQTNGVKNEIKKKKRNSRMKKVRKKLSIGARVKRISHMAGHGGFMGGEVKTVAEVETAVTIQTGAFKHSGKQRAARLAAGDAVPASSPVRHRAG